MGGRGSSTGVSSNGKAYGTEYKSLLTSGNIKFVVRRDGNPSSPMETMNKNRVYVTLDKKGNPKHVGGVPPDYFSKTIKFFLKSIHFIKNNDDTAFIRWFYKNFDANNLTFKLGDI